MDCVTQCSQSAAHLCEQFLQVKQIGFVHWDPYTVHRGGCLELYYCNMVEWFWWDSSLISTTNWLPSVLWHCWFGHLACKNRPQNDLLCVEWDVKPYTLTPITNAVYVCVANISLHSGHGSKLGFAISNICLCVWVSVLVTAEKLHCMNWCNFSQICYIGAPYRWLDWSLTLAFDLESYCGPCPLFQSWCELQHHTGSCCPKTHTV